MVRLALPGVTFWGGVRIWIGDQEIPRENWARVRPKVGVLVNVRVSPIVHGGFIGGGGGGGGGKSPLRTILTIAVLGAAIAFGGPLGAGLFGSSTIGILGATVSTSTIGSAIIGLAGTLLINAVAPTRAPKYNALSATAGTAGSSSTGAQRESPTLSITGTRNQPRLFSVIPSPLGRHRMTPPLGALPFTEIVQSGSSDDQFLKIVVVWGEGPLLIEDLKIAETPLSEFQGVEVFTRQGFDDDPPLRLFTNDVFEEQLSVLLSDEVGWVTRQSSPDADAISVDIIFPKGLVRFTDEGGKRDYSVRVTVQYALVGTEDWKGGGGLIGAQTSPPMPAESGLKNGLPADNPRRYDLVVLERGSGDVSVVPGVVALGGTAPVTPEARNGQVPLARVYRDTSPTIAAGDITDVRPSNAPWANPTDFLVSPTTPASDAVRIAQGTLDPLEFDVTARQTEAVRRSIEFFVGSRDQYKVRLRRTTAEGNDTQILDEVRWTALRTVTFRPPFNADGLATTELRIQASDQLNRVVDQLNGVVTRICLDWDKNTQQWLMRPTRNNASLGRYVLQGGGNPNPRTDDELDLEAFAHWHERCADQSFTFDMVRDFPSNVVDTFQDVASASMATLANHDGRWTVVIDEPGKLPTQHFSERNSFDFSFERNYPDEVHAWRMRFFDEEDGWRPSEIIIYADGYSEKGGEGTVKATKFEELEQVGVTNRNLLRKIGRRRVAEGIARQERWTFGSDIEGIVSTRGDTVLLSNSVISVGLRSGRITGLIFDESEMVVAVEVDEYLTLEPGVDYGISVRTLNNGEIVIPVKNIVGQDVRVLEFTAPRPVSASPQIEDLFSFGIRDRETIEASIVGMRFADNMSVRISAVPYAQPDIENASEGEFPGFDSPVTLPPGAIIPFVVGIRSDETVLRRLPSGVLEPQIRLTLGRPSATLQRRLRGLEVQYRERGSGDAFTSVQVDRQYSLEVNLPRVEQDVTYEIKLRYLLMDDDAPFSSFYYERVIGMATPPPAPLNLVLEGTTLRWSYPYPPTDFRGFLVRTTTSLFAPWESAFPIHEGVVDVAEFSIANIAAGRRAFLVKAVDLAGNKSEDFVRLIRDLGDQLVDNVVSTIDFKALSWPGTVSGATVIGGNLVADSTVLYLPNGGEDYLTPNNAPYLGSDHHTEVIYQPPDFNAPSGTIPSRLTVAVTATVQSVLKTITTGSFFIEYETGEDEPYLLDLVGDYLPIDEDPYLPAKFDDIWRPFPNFVEVFEAVVWRFRLRIPEGQLQTVVSQFDLVFDVPDEQETFPDFAIPVGGARLPITKDFRFVNVVNYTQQDDGGSAYRIVVVDKGVVQAGQLVEGPAVRADDINGVSTTGSADFTIQGAKL